MLCGDVETNPGLDTFNFCCWNLNSIASYDFLCISLIEVYNSVYKYDLIGVVRAPGQDQDEFKSFSDNFELLISNMESGNPFSIVITGDFNCRSNQWWEDDI